MCLAIPGKVLDIDRSVDPVMGTVDFGGVRKQICLAWVPEVTVGAYVIVHVGFAISTLNEQEAKETLELLQQMGESMDRDEASESGTQAGDRRGADRTTTDT